MRLGNKGQSLVEIVIAISVGVLVVGALTFATISSLRGSDFAQKQSQATKLAQEGIEKVRGIRDRDDIDSAGNNFSSYFTTSPCGTTVCYFKLRESDGKLTAASSVTDFEILEGGLKRQIVIEDGASSGEKKITSLVKWSDYSGEHESKLTTILRKL